MKIFGPCESKLILMSLDAFRLMEKDSHSYNEFPELGFLTQNHRIPELRGHLFQVSHFAYGETED
jgi:hypothetical protein